MSLSIASDRNLIQTMLIKGGIDFFMVLITKPQSKDGFSGWLQASLG